MIDYTDFKDLTAGQKHIQRRAFAKYNVLRSCFKLGRLDLIENDFPFNRTEWKYGLSEGERKFFYFIRDKVRDNRLAMKTF